MDAVVEQEAGVVRIADEVAGGGHVFAEQAGAGAERRGAQDVAGDAVGGRVAFHEANDADLAGGLGDVDQRIGFLGSGGGWLFDEDGQAFAHGGGGKFGVLFRTDGHADGVQALGVQQCQRIRGAGGNTVTVADKIQALRVQIGDGGQADIVADELRQQHFAGVIAAADPADIDGHLPPAACSSACRKPAAQAMSESSSVLGGRHCARGTERRWSVRRNGSNVMTPL